LAPRVQVIPFSPDFSAYLAAADLSISMAGYNTCMNILSTGVPALVWPFAQNREQRLRVQRLRRFHALERLSDADLRAEALATKILQGLEKPVRACRDIDLNGADNTARWIEDQVQAGPEG
jgi:predicted glycosyltransferase